MTNGSFSEPFVLLGFVVESPEVYLLQIVGIPVRFARLLFLGAPLPRQCAEGIYKKPGLA